MRPIVLLLFVAVVGLSGCPTRSGLSSGREHEDFEARQARYRKLASEAPPDTWRAGAEWRFVAFDNGGAIAESFVFRVTETPQEACLSGSWKKLEIVSGDGTRLRDPAYAVDGRNLVVLLSTALCDAYPMYRGELSDKGFSGTHGFSHTFGGEEYGKVSGTPIHVPPQLHAHWHP
jgi:hypothetical protein